MKSQAINQYIEMLTILLRVYPYTQEKIKRKKEIKLNGLNKKINEMILLSPNMPVIILNGNG